MLCLLTLCYPNIPCFPIAYLMITPTFPIKKKNYIPTPRSKHQEPRTSDLRIAIATMCVLNQVTFPLRTS